MSTRVAHARKHWKLNNIRMFDPDIVAAANTGYPSISHVVWRTTRTSWLSVNLPHPIDHAVVTLVTQDIAWSDTEARELEMWLSAQVVDTNGGPQCIQISTGSMDYDAGYLRVLVDRGNGFQEVVASNYFDRGTLVYHHCDTDNVVQVAVENSHTNGWGGSITLNGAPMVCTDCDGSAPSEPFARVHVDGNQGAPAGGQYRCYDKQQLMRFIICNYKQCCAYII